LIVLIIHSIAGTCSFLPVMLMVMPTSEKCFLICLNCPSPCRFWTVKLRLWYICITCLMAMAIVADFSFFISSAVQKCMDHDIVMTKGISFMYMMSASSVTLPSLLFLLAACLLLSQLEMIFSTLLCIVAIQCSLQKYLQHAVCPLW